MEIKVIRTEEDYQAALAEVDRLMDAAPGTADFEKLDVLSVLIEKYEDEHDPILMPDPISAIKFRMEQQGLRQKDLEPFIGSQSRVSAVLNGKRQLSKEMIRRLHKGLGIPYEVLMQSPDAAYEEQRYDVGDYPFNAMVHQGYFPGYEGVRGAKLVGERLLDSLFAVFAGKLPTPVYCRHGQKPVDEKALLAWQAHVLSRVVDTSLPAFDAARMDRAFFETLVHFSAYESGVLLVREYLKKSGIHFVIQEHLPKTYLDGASFLTPEGVPVVAMTLRYDRLDHFWFTLLHELAHVKLHLMDAPGQAFFDNTVDESGEDCTRPEQEANDFAWAQLIPEDVWSEAILPHLHKLDQADVVRLAGDLGIHPGIIAGRIRFCTKNFSLFSALVGQGKVRCQFLESQVA
jgi:HTH-type transcriptional regulator/antitoxin HigA